jgi:hypothetical protein
MRHVSAIMFDIDSCSGPILLTDSVNAGRIAISGNVLPENFRPERALAGRIVEDSFRSAE